MFNYDHYYDAPWNAAIELEINGETICVKRLDGIDALTLYDIKPLDQRIVHILASCLLERENKKPIGKEKAEMLVRNQLSFAIDIAVRIIEMSEEMLAQEKELTQELRKN